MAPASARRLEIHPTHPQPRLIAQVVDALRNGAVIVYPTDSCYALGCSASNAQAQDRIAQLLGAQRDRPLTLVCRDLSDLANYAKVDNQAFRLLRSLTPGPYTFVLQATREAPRRLQNPKRKTVGLRVPDNATVQALLAALGDPLLSATLFDREGVDILTEPDDIVAQYARLVDFVVDAGAGGDQPTTILDLTGSEPTLVRPGRGEVLGIT